MSCTETTPTRPTVSIGPSVTYHQTENTSSDFIKFGIGLFTKHCYANMNFMKISAGTIFYQ
jgi:hypothetical protein